jgi:hypothetical protein
VFPTYTENQQSILEFIYMDITTHLKSNGRCFLNAFVILNEIYILIHVDLIISIPFLFIELASVIYFTRGLGIISMDTIFNKD